MRASMVKARLARTDMAMRMGTLPTSMGNLQKQSPKAQYMGPQVTVV